jgi:hypothetical protein
MSKTSSVNKKAKPYSILDKARVRHKKVLLGFHFPRKQPDVASSLIKTIQEKASLLKLKHSFDSWFLFRKIVYKGKKANRALPTPTKCSFIVVFETNAFTFLKFKQFLTTELFYQNNPAFQVGDSPFSQKFFILDRIYSSSRTLVSKFEKLVA